MSDGLLAKKSFVSARSKKQVPGSYQIRIGSIVLPDDLRKGAVHLDHSEVTQRSQLVTR